MWCHTALLPVCFSIKCTNIRYPRELITFHVACSFNSLLEQQTPPFCYPCNCCPVNFPPLFLLIYPTETFQKLLGCLKITWPALHIFADVFHSGLLHFTSPCLSSSFWAVLFREAGWTSINNAFFHRIPAFCTAMAMQKKWLNILASLGLATLWILKTE